MAFPSRMIGDYEFSGAVNLTGTASLPAGAVTNTAVLTGANVSESKLQHRIHAKLVQNSTAAIVARSEIIHYAYKPETVLGAYLFIDTKAASTGRTVTVNVRKSTAGSTWASILTAALTKNSTNTTSRTGYALTLSGTPTLIAGDALLGTVAVAGSTGTQATGMLLDVIVAENGA